MIVLLYKLQKYTISFNKNAAKYDNKEEVVKYMRFYS